MQSAKAITSSIVLCSLVLAMRSWAGAAWKLRQPSQLRGRDQRSMREGSSSTTAGADCRSQTGDRRQAGTVPLPLASCETPTPAESREYRLDPGHALLRTLRQYMI